ncbi:Iron(III)-zinc(II) purple acid phosphatase, putative [Phytophthora infestans T30-4]|uniref:Purple acid phosphatase n=1 Tax=Phytophthora infestans (strain T30-4) TaxID=403677 RepID=D0MQE1_PHYIT|nr:Iron(III)-zinc(II) purple acid phosphatase, putative [Phytophthora infestans T30-4]EEY57710.1 Iron(III)-zinc(II) purple acid phosphatase, putative [Phytophthora infestans T30-4]|eukprot:XP_002908896.1 Iron(III)-zinc(II) purple acid phosphatase, putative [Phytophthora infestans T30-4]
MAVVGVSLLLFASAFVLVNMAQVPVYDANLVGTNSMLVTDPAPPSQIHIALAEEVEVKGSSASRTLNAAASEIRLGMTISWATDVKTMTSSVRYGLSKDDLSMLQQSEEPCEQYDFCSYTSPWLHHVTIPGDKLEPNTNYYYQCGDETGGWSTVYTFKTAIPVGNETSQTFGVIGDLGQTEYSEQTIRHLAGYHSTMSAIVCAGDLSYADSEQYRWDRWGKLVEPLIARMPWMTAPGNHEVERPCQADVSEFVAYQTRFRMPYDRKDQLQRRNLYYGFRVGLVHFIILTPYVDSTPTSPQYEWVQQEFQRVDRSVTPCNTAHQGLEPHMVMKKHMEDILYRNKVDVVLAGHVHAYERSHPAYKEKVVEDGPVFVVLGDAGNREGLAPTYFDPQPEWSAFRQADYGFSLLNVVNRTHASMQWFEDRAEGDAILRDTVALTTSKYRSARDYK